MKMLEERFASKFTIGAADDCWPWAGSKNNQGYGQIYSGERARTMLATHAALLLSGQPRPTPKHGALHSCDNPSCVNPRHLRWGLHRENMHEMRDRGRLNTAGLKEWPKRNPQNKRKTHCKRGHVMAGDNLYVSPKLKRMCAVCERERKFTLRAKAVQTELELTRD
jgi:hypothetical protein